MFMLCSSYITLLGSLWSVKPQVFVGGRGVFVWQAHFGLHPFCSCLDTLRPLLEKKFEGRCLTMLHVQLTLDNSHISQKTTHEFKMFFFFWNPFFFLSEQTERRINKVMFFNHSSIVCCWFLPPDYTTTPHLIYFLSCSINVYTCDIIPAEDKSDVIWGC